MMLSSPSSLTSMSILTSLVQYKRRVSRRSKVEFCCMEERVAACNHSLQSGVLAPAAPSLAHHSNDHEHHKLDAP